MEHEKNDTPQGQVTTEEQIDMIADHIGNLLDAPEPTKTDEGESTQPTEREVTEVKAGSEPPKAPADDMKADEKPAKEVTAERIKIKWEGEERELTKDELVELAQKGYDYTRKTQALAERERQLAPLEGIAKTVQSDPAFAAYLRDYFLQKGKPKTEEQPPPKFDDP
ncbi:MAG TPA: hypothetical protein P5244_16505, partial [Syntrophales bacterium]|nr:hypothetical protein [Syntrophales bacterium]